MAIQQHPLPQDISAYRFRLIGDMTIKQFVSLGVGIVMAVIFYSSPLPFFFKYPLSFLFLLLGVGMAFVPIQGRTLDTWIIAFIRSIYSPTQFVWKQTSLKNINLDTAAPTNAANLQMAPGVSNAKMQISTGVVAPVVNIAPPSTEPISTSSFSPLSKGDGGILPPVISPITPPPTIPVTSPEPITNNQQPTTPPTTHLPIPYTPTTPNTLVGLTITPDSKILDGVLVEIQKNGLTTRATKSNKLGQFMFARPLDNGLYQIFSEKEGFFFDPYSLELTGAIVRPLKIQAKKNE
jgi:hypothetical protein